MKTRTTPGVHPSGGYAVEVLADGALLPIVSSPAEFAAIDGRDERSIRADCDAGIIPTLPRRGGLGSRWSIVTAQALEQRGIACRIVRIGTPSGHGRDTGHGGDASPTTVSRDAGHGRDMRHGRASAAKR